MLYQLSYASASPELRKSRGKIDSAPGSVKTTAHFPDPVRLVPLLRGGRPSGGIRKGSQTVSELTVGCLFPLELGATGMNSSTPTASLTGRIWFFLLLFLEPLLTD